MKEIAEPYSQAHSLQQSVMAEYRIQDLGPLTGYLWGSGTLVGQGMDHGGMCSRLDQKPPPGRYVIRLLQGAGRQYDVMKTRALYLALAEAKPTEEGVLGFVSKHGMLGREEYLCHDPSNPNLHYVIEPVSAYVAEIVRMNLAVRMLRFSRLAKLNSQFAAEAEYMRSILQYDVQESGRAFPPPATQVIRTSWIEASDANAEFSRRYPNSLAGMIAIDWDKEYTETQMLQRLALNFATEHTNAELLRGVSPIAQFDRRIRNLHLCPRYLLAGLYLQIAIEIAGMSGLRTCEVCKGPLPAGSNSKRKTCSDKCRQALSERNKKEKQDDVF